MNITKFHEKDKYVLECTIDYDDDDLVGGEIVANQGFHLFLGRAIALVRIRRKVSQRLLARWLSWEIGKLVHASYICKLEQGDLPNIGNDRLHLIAKLLKCRVSLIVEIAEYLAEAASQEIDEEALLQKIMDEAERRFSVSERRKLAK
jgi:hypothetical protein